MGIELELIILLFIQTIGVSTFAVFEVETPAWRKILKWSIISGGTIGLYYLVGHWALLLPLAGAALGTTVHIIICRREGFHPIYATPRQKYYAYRGWEWQE